MLIPMTDVQQYRHEQLLTLTNEKGVYALCDLDGVAIYIGKSVDGIRSRVRRHLTSARSDVIANRLVDVWEVAYVWGWPAQGKMAISALENQLYHQMNTESALMNSQVPGSPLSKKISIPEKQAVQILTDAEIQSRLQARNRFSRQAHQLSLLLDYILEIKNNEEMQRSLAVHFDRLEKYHRQYQAATRNQKNR